MFFANFKETADKLPDEMRLKYYDAITEYVFNEKEPEDPVMAALINSIKPSLDKKINLGGAPLGNNNACKNKTTENNLKQPKTTVVSKNNLFQETETETRNGNIETEVEKEKEKEKVATAPRFKKPKLEEVSEYSKQSGLFIDDQAFMDFYESKGWKVGNQPMKDWKAAVRNWARRDKVGMRKPVESLTAHDSGQTESISDIVDRMWREQNERAV